MASIRTTRAVMTIRTEQDIALLEAQPYDEVITAGSVYDVFRTTARLHGNRPALTVLASADPADVAVTYTHAELFSEITRAANMFSELGIGPQRPVAILSRTHSAVPTLLWGAQTAGVASCINYLLSADVVAALLEVQNARVLVCPGPDLDSELWAKAQEVARRASSLDTVLVIGGAGAVDDPRFVDLETTLSTQPGDRIVGHGEPGRNDVAALFHTGGTTGLPKLVPQTHLNQIHAAWSLAQLFDLSETDVVLNGFPFFHVGGTSTVGMSVLAAGGHVVVLTPSGFRDTGVMKNIWRLVERYRATVLGGVPTSIGGMTEVPLGRCDISSLRFVLTGGASLPGAVAQRFEQLTDVPLLEQYGMTETVAALATTPLHGRHVRGSVGLRCPYSDIRILTRRGAEEWETCASGEVGVVTVSGPQVIGGYLDPRHNAEAFTADGALITGDLGYLDEQGYLHLTGRQKDLIIRSGHNIDPASIEEVANAHPGVSLSAAVGMPDEYAGEVPVVFVSPVPGQTVEPEELRDFIHAHIHEPPARPRHVFLLDEIPVTGVGKIFKPTLRALAARHKLQMLVDGLDENLEIRSIENTGTGDSRFLVRLAPTSGDIEVDRVERALRQAVAELPIEVDTDWARDGADSPRP